MSRAGKVHDQRTAGWKHIVKYSIRMKSPLRHSLNYTLQTTLLRAPVIPYGHFANIFMMRGINKSLPTTGPSTLGAVGGSNNSPSLYIEYNFYQLCVSPP